MTPRSKTAKGILVELEMGRDQVEREKKDEREREEEYRRHSQVCVGRLGSGVYEEEERCSRAGHSEGMARRGEELSAPLKSVGTVCN